MGSIRPHGVPWEEMRGEEQGWELRDKNMQGTGKRSLEEAKKQVER